ncbi:MAG: tetratricopeptide repeat protein, partial [Leptospira sp.]|nr:tetratricopeptide repeat protein [Leptospira sp.]
MSSFQKNTLLTILILAFIAYPPLYYSIKETVEKESRPIEYTSPKTVPFLSLAPIEVKNYKTEPGFPLVLEAGLDQLLSESGNLVYLGVWEGLSEPNRERTEFILSGDLEILDSAISFTPKLEWKDSKKKYKGKSIQVSFEEIGELLP